MSHLVHSTALVVGTTGLLLLGPSGSGKSATAINLLSMARLAGHFAALVSDDQVMIETIGQALIASAPETIRGMIECRGTGIARTATIAKARLHLAVELVSVNAANRIQDDERRWLPGGSVSLPLLSLDRSLPNPYAALEILIAGFPVAKM